MTKFWYGLGDLIYSSFDPIEKIGYLANGVIMVTGFIFFIVWLYEMSKFEKEEKHFS